QKRKIRHRRQFGEPRLEPDQGRRRSCAYENKARTKIEQSSAKTQAPSLPGNSSRSRSSLAGSCPRGEPRERRPWVLNPARAVSEARHRVEEQVPEAVGVDRDGDLGVGEATPLAAPVDDRG